MKKFVLVILVLITLCACSNTNKIADEYKAEYKTIEINKVRKLIKEGNTIIIDVRSKKEYKKRHMKNAINIPYNNIDSIINDVSKDSIVVIYAEDKKVSKKATNKVIDLGYSLVYDLGKYKNWN